MAVRKCIGRVRTTPSGYDFNDVLKKGKAFHKNSDFEMQPYRHEDRVLWMAEYPTSSHFKAPEGTIKVKRLEKGWEIIK